MEISQNFVAFSEYMNLKVHSAQGRDLASIFGDLSQSEKFSATFRRTWTTGHSEIKIGKKYTYKKLLFQTILFPFSSPHIYATSCSLNIIIIRRNIIQQLKKKKKKRTNKTEKKEERKKSKPNFSFLFEAPLVILLRTTTKWLTKRVRPQFIL